MNALSPCSLCTAGGPVEQGWIFSGDGKSSTPEGLAQLRKNLLSLGDAMCPEKGYPAGRFTNPGADLDSTIARPHPVGGIRKPRGKCEGFVRA
jgi:hypothetical protein